MRVYIRSMGNIQLTPELLKQITYSAAILIIALVVMTGLQRALILMARQFNLPMLNTRPLRLVIRYSVLVLAISLILQEFHINDMGTVLKVIGTVMGLVAIGFVATWSVLSNFLCTFVLILFKPFAIGDEVEIPGDAVAGRVVDITLIFTTLRSSAGEYVQVPNNMFFQKIFKRRAGAGAIELGQQLREEKPAE